MEIRRNKFVTDHIGTEYIPGSKNTSENPKGVQHETHNTKSTTQNVQPQKYNLKCTSSSFNWPVVNTYVNIPYCKRTEQDVLMECQFEGKYDL